MPGGGVCEFSLCLEATTLPTKELSKPSKVLVIQMHNQLSPWHEMVLGAFKTCHLILGRIEMLERVPGDDY
jgi:hypothetical protein